MTCSNCGAPLERHCHIHAIPCCPGKCVGLVRTKHDLAVLTLNELSAVPVADRGDQHEAVTTELLRHLVILHDEMRRRGLRCACMDRIDIDNDSEN